jgi:hypothetical protein
MKITVSLRNAPDTIAIVKPSETWQTAAARAVKRAHGRRASVWGWTCNNWQEDHNGRVIASFYCGTVVNNPAQRGGGHAVIDEASVTIR